MPVRRAAVEIQAMVVRPAERVDVGRIEELSRETDALHARLWPSYFRSTPDGRRRSAFAAALDAADEILLVAQAGDRLVGFVWAQVFHTPDAPPLVHGRRLKIEELVVGAAARRRGVGRRLLGEAMAWGARRGAVEAVLAVWDGNSAAQRFYRAVGFRPVHRVLGMPIADGGDASESPVRPRAGRPSRTAGVGRAGCGR